MRRKEKARQQAIKLRLQGKSINQIAYLVDASKSSVSTWVREVKLTNDQKVSLNNLGNNGYYCDAQREEYEKNPKLCPYCGKSLPYRKRGNKYCNLACAGKHNASKRKKTKKKCLNCGQEANNKFCCLDCNFEYKQKQQIIKAKETGLTPAHQTTAKKLVIAIRGHSCERCGQTEWMSEPIPLVLDHINGKCTDWRLDNLRLVCGNCDMQLPTYKSKNKNSQRKKRVGKW